MISEYTLIDTQGCSHALQLHEDRLLLDQQPVLTIQQAAVIVFVISEGQEQGQEIACTPQACWDAFAGAGAIPTAAEAGRLLADHLAHWIDEQRLRVFLQAFIGDRAPALLLPQPRLDPFVEAALSRCEPTPTLAKVEALAQVLDQPPALVAAWLRQRGKTVLLPEEAPEAASSDSEEEGRAGVGVEKHEAQSAPTKRVMFRWTSERIERLTAEFLTTPPDQSVSSAAKAIAGRHRWPAESTEYKIYHLGLPQQRLARPSTSAPRKEDGAQAEPEAQVEIADSRAAASPPAPEAAQPVELCRGNFVWDVRVDDRIQRWFLDYPYGDFPARKGELVVYQGTTYALQMVGSNTLRAWVQPPPVQVQVQVQVQEETPPVEMLKVG